MKNVFDSSLPAAQRQMAENVIQNLGLSGLRVSLLPETASIQFIQDRRVVTVPTQLIVEQKWRDIRHLFRAILERSPAVENTGAPNEWGPENDHYGYKS